MTVEVIISVVVVTGILILYLQGDMALLFGKHPCRFLITEHTEHDIYTRYPELIAKYEAALAANHIEKIKVDNPSAVRAFAEFESARCLSVTQCADLAACIQEDAAIMMVDPIATKLAQKLSMGLKLFTTKQLFSELGLALENPNDCEFPFSTHPLTA